MHELSIVENIVSTTLQFTKEHQIDRVSFLTIQVGKLTGVEPPYLHMYYGDLTKDTALEGSELKVEEILPEDETYQDYYQKSMEMAGVTASAEDELKTVDD